MIYIIFGYVWHVKTKPLNNPNLIIKLTGIIRHWYYSQIRLQVSVAEDVLFIIYLLIILAHKHLFYGTQFVYRI